MGSELMSGVFADAALPDFVVRSENGSRELHMTTHTFRSLVGQDALGWVCAALEARPDGSWRVPRTFGDRDIADEIELMLTYAEAGPSTVCVLPTCGQPAEASHRDFPLCALHIESLQGWDDLVAKV